MATEHARKLPPRSWESFFRKAGVRVEDLDATKGNKAKSIKIGRFLSPNVNREVPIEVKGRSGKAVLRVSEGRSREKRYYFEVTWDDESAVTTPHSEEHATPDGHKAESEAKAKRETAKPTAKGRKDKVKTKEQTARATTPGAATTGTKGKRTKAENKGSGNDEDW